MKRLLAGLSAGIILACAIISGYWLTRPKGGPQPWLDRQPDTMTAYNYTEQSCVLSEEQWETLAPALQEMEGRRVLRKRTPVDGGHYQLVLRYDEQIYEYLLVSSQYIERYENGTLAATYSLQPELYVKLLHDMAQFSYGEN